MALDEDFDGIFPNNFGIAWKKFFFRTWSKCYLKPLYPYKEYLFNSFLDSCIFFKNLILVSTDNPEEDLKRSDRKL